MTEWTSEHGPKLIASSEEEEAYVAPLRPSKAAERREGRKAIREDLEDLEDFYPEISHVRYVARF